MRIAAVTRAEREGPFLLEWIAHQRRIGVTDLIVYRRETGDGTGALLAALAQAGVLTAAEAPGDLAACLRAARATETVRQADWTWVCLPGEFLDIRAGTGTLPDLIAACGADLVSVPTQVFAGDTGAYDEGPLTRRLTRSHNPDIRGASLSLEVRTLSKGGLPLLALGPHRPFLRARRLQRNVAPADRPVWTDASARPVSRGFYMSGPDAPAGTLPAAGAREHATLNVYRLKSLESHIALHATVSDGRIAPGFDETDWRELNDDAWEDTGLAARAPALEAEIAALKALPGVAEAQAACVALHRAAIEAVKAAEGYAALRDRLTGLPRLPAAEVALMTLLGVA